MKHRERTEDIVFSVIGGLVIFWIALLTAPYVQQGLIGIVKNLGTVMSDPFKITWCEDSLKTILVFLDVIQINPWLCQGRQEL